MNPVFIKATDLQDAWFQAVYNILEHGREFIIDKGSFEGQKRLEFDYITIQITHPHILPLLPKLNPLLGLPDPVAEGYLDDYLPYLMTGEEQPGEAYTYGQRICKTFFEYPNLNGAVISSPIHDLAKSVDNNSGAFSQDPESDFGFFLNQMELMIWTYKNKGHRNNQMIMQVGQPDDMLLLDPPCLRHIDTRIQDGKLHFFPYFRSWDLWSGFPANLAAIEMMKQYCTAQIGVGNGEIIASSKGCHIYDYVVTLAEAVRGKTVNEFKNESKMRY